MDYPPKIQGFFWLQISEKVKYCKWYLYPKHKFWSCGTILVASLVSKNISSYVAFFIIYSAVLAPVLSSCPLWYYCYIYITIVTISNTIPLLGLIMQLNIVVSYIRLPHVSERDCHLYTYYRDGSLCKYSNCYIFHNSYLQVFKFVC